MVGNADGYECIAYIFLGKFYGTIQNKIGELQQQPMRNLAEERIQILHEQLAKQNHIAETRRCEQLRNQMEDRNQQFPGMRLFYTQQQQQQQQQRRRRQGRRE